MDYVMTVDTGDNSEAMIPPSRFNLLLTKESDTVDGITYGWPIGMSDHVMIEFRIR